MTIVVDVEAHAVYIQAPGPVRLDVHGAHRLSSAAGEAHWIVLTGEDPPREPV